MSNYVHRLPPIIVLGPCITPGCEGQVWARVSSKDAYCMLCGEVWSQSQRGWLLDKMDMLGPCLNSGCYGRLRLVNSCARCAGKCDSFERLSVRCDECGDSMTYLDYADRTER